MAFRVRGRRATSISSRRTDSVSLRSSSALALVVLASAPARAADAPSGERVRVEYSAPAECPSQQAFEVELSKHLGAATFARFGELARTLSVDLERVASGFRARVELVDRQGQATERGISAPTCEEGMRAIALVAALAARSQVEEADRERAANAAPTTNEAAVSAPPPIALQASPVPSAPERSAPTSEPSTRTERDEPFVGFGVSVGAAASTGVGPGVAPGLLAAFRVALTGATERSLVLSAYGFDTFRKSLDVADARFSVLKGRLELCPIEPRLSDDVFVSSCAGFELGSHSGRSYPDGERVETSHTASGLWAAASLALRLRIRFGAFELGLGPELGVPFRRNQFALTGPERPVYEVPRITVGGSLSVGLAWQ
jgi:hypothetical protein